MIGMCGDRVEYVSDAAGGAFPPGTGGPDILRLGGPVLVDRAVKSSGIEYAEMRYLVFFADVMAYGGQDEEFGGQTAAAWSGGQPALHSRRVKFFRAEADRQTMFNPGDWPLPDRAMIWRFSEAPGLALVAHADTFPQTSQYFYMPQTRQTGRTT